MKGGVIQVYPTMTPQAAFRQFITNCASVRILTDTSRSSITLLFGDCPENQSPYYHTRISHGFRITDASRRVRHCLIKLVLLAPPGQPQQIIARPFLMSNSALDRPDFLLETPASIVAEVNLQHRIFRDSSFPIAGANGAAPPQCYFSPICPAIINYTTNIDQVNLEWFRDLIFARIAPFLRVPRPRPGEPVATSNRRHDGQILLDFFNYAIITLMPQGGGVGLVTMEFMSDCMTLGAYLGVPGRTAAERQFMFNLSYIQIRRLGALGIVHQDCHVDNIMVNTTHRYLPPPYQLGNAFLIDFGNTRLAQPTWNFPIIMPRYQYINRDYLNVAYAGQLMQSMHAYNRAFLDQVRHQITPQVPVATVDDFIARALAAIIAILGPNAPNLNGGGRTSSENRFSNKKISFDEFIDMIINDMKPPVKFDLIETTNNNPRSHKSPLNKSRYSPRSHKSPLNKSRYSPRSHKSPLNKSRYSPRSHKSPLNKSRRRPSPNIV